MRDIISDYLVINPMINFLNIHSQTGRNTFFYVAQGYDPLHKGKVLKLTERFNGIFTNRIPYLIFLLIIPNS